MFHNHTLLDATRIPFVPAVGGGVTFDPAHKTPNIVLSGSNLVATAGAGIADSEAVRSTTSHAAGTGKYYFEMTCSGTSVGLQKGVGLVSPSFTLGGTFIGGDPQGIGVYAITNSSVYYNLGALLNFGAEFGNGAVIRVALDTGSNNVWFAINGSTWNNAGGDPTNPTDPQAIDVPFGSWYAAAGFQSGTAGTIFTANFGPTYAFTKPAGYNNW